MRPRLEPRDSFSLVEVVLAMGVASFCLIPLIGLLTVGLTTSQVSNDETQAIHLMNQVANDLQVAFPSAASSSPFYRLTLPSDGGSSTMTAGPQSLYLAADGSATGGAGTAPGSRAAFRVTLGFRPPPASTTGLSSGTAVRILVTWPAAADANPAVWPAHYAGSVETVFVLNKN